MTVLVTGGAGYIGSHTVLELLDAGEPPPVVLDDLSTGFRWSVPEGTPLVVGDFGDADLVADLIERYAIDEIIHFAAKIVVPDSVADPLGYYLNNTAKARALLATSVARRVKRFIFSSTAAVYGDPLHNPVTEDEPLKPVSPYGRSKLMVEWMLEDTARAHGLAYVALRYFNVSGADPKGRSGQSTPNATHLIKVAVQTALGLRPKLQVFGDDYPTPDGTCVRDYIQVTDLSRAHLDALRYLRDGGANLTANCGYERGFSVLEVIESVKRVSGVDFDVQISPRRPGDPAAIVAANERIRRTLGWTPQHDDLDEIVRQALEWEKRLMARGG
ncbi:UDP-glucose 4-epimerase GalE [Methylocystis hirsuta]|uniref:UDP-glucose 4-epimerase n=1 Tax=Methylocystis hirsuta TaxID=369798 RepID=A0A3M9XRD4_9HYPH|nr:UDP-glucose 4-epimerase GalE [Methylocystis hirsuta]RNJ50837.1 UDP-glucose 4-epimerase GalE [Methylocystis hirsuta]